MTGRVRGRDRGRRWWGRWGASLLLGVTAGLAPSALPAQAVLVDGPSRPQLTTATPALQVRAIGFGQSRPITLTLQVSTTADFTSVVLDSTFDAIDSTVAVQITRPLPSDAAVFWRVSARVPAGPQALSATTGPWQVPPWLTLLSPNSPAGNPLDVRRPLFVWRSAPVTAATGTWRYDLEITEDGRAQIASSGLRDTTFRPFIDLQANTSYRWNVRAWLPTGASTRVFSQGSFVIDDPPLPTSTILYQNFPNPFPTPVAQATCFWFDVGQGGARISLDIVDLRGNLVKRIVPGDDNVERFDAGRFGRGVPGSDSNCGNQFTWNGTGTDGRTVKPGVYLARFRADNGTPIFRRILFVGR